MISIGILSYFAPNTLNYTLDTYKKNGLLELSDDIFVILQFSSRQGAEKTVCDSYGIRSICLPDNGRMAWGFKMIFENARNDYILFLENDFVINTTQENTANFINNCIYFLKDEKADIVRGRSRNEPGQPNYAFENLRNIRPENFVNNTHLSECIYWVNNPDELYPLRITKVEPKYGKDCWYKSNSKYCNYTNNPYACSKNFFRNAILPYIEFGKDLESELTSAWTKCDYTCLFGPGLFTHNRSYDGHV